MIYFQYSVMLDPLSLTTTIHINFSTIAERHSVIPIQIETKTTSRAQAIHAKMKRKPHLIQDGSNDTVWLRSCNHRRELVFFCGVYRYVSGIQDYAVLGMLTKCMQLVYNRPDFLRYSIIRNYKHLVKSVGLDPEILGALLECTSSLLAGSFVLQCLTGECFHSCPTMCDMDIFVPAVNIEVVVQYLYTVDYDAEHFESYSDEFPRVHSRLRLTHRFTGHKSRSIHPLRTVSIYSPSNCP